MKTTPVLLFVFLAYASCHAQLAIVVNAGSDSATVFNTIESQVVASVATGLRPQDVRVSLDGKRAYVLNMGSGTEPGNTIDVYDLEKYARLSTINLGRHQRPHWAVLSSNGKLLWVACANQNAILEIDLLKERIQKVWNTEQPGSYNFGVSSTDKIYTANYDSTTVSIINRKTGKTKIVVTGGKPIGVDVTKDGKEVWISCDKTNEVVVFDAVNDEIISRFPSGGNAPTRLKISNDGKLALVTHSASRDLSVYKTDEKKLFWKIPLDGNFPKGLTVTHDDRFAFVSLGGGTEVLKVDLEKREVIRRIKTGKNPEGIVMLPQIKRTPLTVAHTISENDLIPEGIAFDPVEGSFYVSSTYKRKIVKINAKGSSSNFIDDQEDGIYGVLGMRVDTKRRILWAASGDVGAGMPIKNGKPEDNGNSSLFKYDLATGKLLRRHTLRKDSNQYFLNDLVLDDHGMPYVTDTRSGRIYCVDPATDSLQVFLDLPKQYRPNGIDFSPDYKYLFVALYASPKSCFGRIDIKTKELEIIKLPTNWPAGADGLYYYNKSLLAILPGATQNRIIQYYMNDDMTEITDMKIHVENDPLLSQPTTGVIVKRKLYFVATSNLQLFARMFRENGGYVDLNRLPPVRIGEISLK